MEVLEKWKIFCNPEWNPFLITNLKVSLARHSVNTRSAGLSEWLRRYGWTVMDHSPYSSDLAPSDFHLFGPIKKHLVGKRFPSDVNVKKAVSSVTGTWFRFFLHRNYKPCCHGGSNSLLSMMTVWRCDVHHPLRMFRTSVLAYCFVISL